METLKPVTILVVDDNTENLKVVGNILKESNYKIAFALNGSDAIEIVETTPVTLILLDIMMPLMDGYEVCNKLRSHPNTKHIPIIFLTAKVDTDDIVKGFSLGAIDYITKPFKKEELICRINNHLELINAKAIIKHQAEELKKSNALLMQALQNSAKYIPPKQ